MHTIGAGVYEELVRFLAGRTDWARLTARLAESFVNDIAQRIGDALYKSVDSVGSTYKANVSGSNGELKTKVLEIADHVEAANGQAVIVGTKAALRKLKPEDSSDLQKVLKTKLVTSVLLMELNALLYLNSTKLVLMSSVLKTMLFSYYQAQMKN